MKKTIQTIACELLNSSANNGFGIKCEAVTQVLKENNIEFRELWLEIVKQGKDQSCPECGR